MSRNLEPTQRVDPDISFCDRDGDVFGNNYKIINKGPYSTEVVVPCGSKKKAMEVAKARMEARRRDNETGLILKLVLIIAVIIGLLTLASRV
jgi:hypothetical protein